MSLEPDSPSTLLLYRKKNEEKEEIPNLPQNITLVPEEEDYDFKTGDFLYNFRTILIIICCLLPILHLLGK